MPQEGRPLRPYTEILRYEEIAAVVQAACALGVRKVRLTGGEPLVRRDLPQLVGMLSAIPGLTDLSLTTNGQGLAQAVSNLAEAGLQRVNISLDSLNADKYRRITRGGDISLVWRGIEAALDAGFRPLKLNVVVMRGGNLDELPDFARLTLMLPLEVRFIEFMPLANRYFWEPGRYVPAKEMLQYMAQAGELLPLPNAGLAQCFRLTGALGTLGLIGPLSTNKCAACQRLRLTADGHLRPCLFSSAEMDVKPALRQASSPEEIYRLLQQAVWAKPWNSSLLPASLVGADPGESRGMSAIGG